MTPPLILWSTGARRAL